MSEGNSIKKDPIENIISSNIRIPIGTSNNNEVVIQTSDPAESSSHQRASTPRAGALVVVEAYAKVFGGTNQIFAPEKFLYEYIEHLIFRICNTTGSDINKDVIQSLVDVVELALRVNQGILTGNSVFVESVVSVLRNQKFKSSLSPKDQNRVQTINRTLQILRLGLHGGDIIMSQPPPPSSSAASASPSQQDGIGTSIPSLVDRISFSDDGASAIAHYLSELGPSSTRSTGTFREVLSEYSRTTGPINESTLAGLVYFFSDKVNPNDNSSNSNNNNNNNNGNGLSSTLLGSIMSNRGHDSSGNVQVQMNWNVDVVAKVLNEDFINHDWNAVSTFWDIPSFKIRDAAQFRIFLDLYRAGSNRLPPLPAFTARWRNTTGQLSCLEAIMSVPPNVYIVPLNDDEQADAATAPPPLPNSIPNQQCWASLEILQRLLQLSDVPSLYRRVRDLFVRCLLTCPEVLLCSLVRLQLRVANTATLNDGLVNSGTQLKTELMRELIPLFFRPGSHSNVRNAGAALRRLYTISPTTVMAACYEAWRSASQDSAQVRLSIITHIINIARLLPNPTDAVANLLSGSRDAEYSIAIAFVMSDNDFLQLKPWLGEKLSSAGSVSTFAVALISYIRKSYTTAAPKGGGPDGAPLVSIENIASSLQLLKDLDPTVLAQPVTGIDRSVVSGPTIGDNVRALIEICLSTHPVLRSSLRPAANQNVASDDVEEMATAYFQKIYTSEQSIGEVVEMLKRFKTSGNVKENEIFACMVHNLFDEYRFFAKYPEKELRITGILFGALIQEQLVSSITLGIALRYVLEALRKPPSPSSVATSSGKMFKFGMFALEQFKGRLHEWPQYCSHIVQIPHLKEGYADLVTEIEQEMTKNQQQVQNKAAPAATANSMNLLRSASGPNEGGFTPNADQSTDQQLAASAVSKALDPVITLPSRNAAPLATPGTAPKVRVAEFGKGLGRAVTEGVDEERDLETPTDAILDKVQFLVNNLAPSNVEKKAQELKEMLNPKYFGWLGHFLVVKRISTQANFHSLYLSFLDHLGEYGKGLVEAILNSVFRNIGKLLRSPKITTSSSERSYLKNLGIWLGQITLARNRPILQIMLDCKELLLQGYETGKLIAVAPFLAKTLEGAKNSVVFRPPNPWLMGLLGVFRAVYNVEGLKMNIKFEVEVLCKNLSVRLEDIPIRSNILAHRIAPIKERNPDFNIKSTTTSAQKPTAALPPTRGSVTSPEILNTNTAAQHGEESGRTTPTATDHQDTVIPNLATYVTVNPNLPQLLQAQGGSVLSNLTAASLKRWVPLAVDRAIREIIQPVVERSVSIACITTKEIVTKDFAMESDESKMRKAGQLMVANLAGSLALVTCREPLRSSVSSHLRQLLSNNLGRSDNLGEQEQNVIEQCVQICATDNLELGCRLIEKAATEKAVRDVDDALSDALNSRRQYREQTGKPFYDMSIFANGNQRYPALLPDPLRPKPGGLQTEHLHVYDSFQRISRQNQSLGTTTTNTTTTAPSNVAANVNRSGTPVFIGAAEEIDAGVTSKPNQAVGAEVLSTIVAKLDGAVTALLSAAGTRARDIKLAMLPPEHQICQLLSAIKQVMPNASPTGGVARPLNTSEQDVILSFSQSVFKRLYELSLSEPLRLEAFVAVLENINLFCPKLGKDMGTWATYAPTNTEPQRRLHRTMLLLLVRSRLLSVLDLDSFLTARADHGRNHVWVEFSLVFIRTAFVERIASPSDFPKLIDLMTRIANGSSQATPPVAQAVRKPILQMLEEARPANLAPGPNAPVGPPVSAAPVSDVPVMESSSLSVESLTRLFEASEKVSEVTEAFSRADPANSRQQVTALLEGWFRIQSEQIVNEKSVLQFLQMLQQVGVGKSEEQTERFLRLSTVVVVESVLKSAPAVGDGARNNLNYTVIDLFSKLLLVLIRQVNPGATQDQISVQRLSMLNKVLGVIVRCMMWQSKKVSGVNCWDQRPWFRLLLNMLIDMNKPEPVSETLRLGILNVFGVAFHVCQPLALPGFAFAWLELISHRHFLPNILILGQKAWHIAHHLMIDLFLFLEPYLRRIDLTQPIKKLYEGSLRVLLVMLHDFPSFLAGYHLSFCNVIPESCVQVRNIILSASPKGVTPPDPFTPNLKIDLLPEISQVPTILSNVLGPIENIRGPVDSYLNDGQRRNFLASLLPLLCKEGTTEVCSSRVNSLVIYVGAFALARIQSSQISLSRTPDIELFQTLMEFDDRGRYVCLNAIANQLRFPNSHTHYFSCVLLYLFSESKTVAVKEQVTRVLLERLIVNRPHPWGLLITFIELIKNQRYGFWSFPFTRCATEIEKVFESVARSCMPPGAQRTTLLVGDEQ